MKTINDPVHGTMRFEGPLVELLASPEVVRLNQVRQLGLAYLVFPGAQHTRFEHSMGVSTVAGRIGREIGLPDDETMLLRTAGLLHDIGHGPFSHTLEGIFKSRIGLDHMELTRDLIEGNAKLDLDGWSDPSVEDMDPVHVILERHGIEPSSVSSLVCQDGDLDDPEQSRLSDPAGKGHFGTERYKAQIIHSALDADQLDFLLRDSHYTGAAHGTIDLDRIVQTAVLHNGELMVHRRGISALEGMLVARALMYSSVYFHKTARIAEAMLCKAASGLGDDDLRELWNLSDAEALYRLKDRDGVTGSIARRLRLRRLYKAALTIDSEEAYGEGPAVEGVKDIVREASSEKGKLSLEERICAKAKVSDGAVIVDVPDPSLTLSEPRLKRTDVKVLSERPVNLSRLSSIARALQHRPAVPWCLMVSCPPGHRDAGRSAARRELLA